MVRQITGLQMLDCDWSVHKFIEVNFSKLMDSNQIAARGNSCAIMRYATADAPK